MLDQKYHKMVRLHLVMLNAATTLEDLKSPGNQVEKLSKDRAGQHALRITLKYRVCFIWNEGGAEQVEVTDYH